MGSFLSFHGIPFEKIPIELNSERARFLLFIAWDPFEDDSHFFRAELGHRTTTSTGVNGRIQTADDKWENFIDVHNLGKKDGESEAMIPLTPSVRFYGTATKDGRRKRKRGR